VDVQEQSRLMEEQLQVRTDVGIVSRGVGTVHVKWARYSAFGKSLCTSATVESS